jgi:hypothetical protein
MRYQKVAEKAFFVGLGFATILFAYHPIWAFSATEIQGLCDENQVNTAIGCIDTTGSFITKFLQIGIGISGGIAFLLILMGGFQIMTSAGNPEQLNAGRELVTSAITGLILIIFSVFLLKLIGVNILTIPGFS